MYGVVILVIIILLILIFSTSVVVCRATSNFNNKNDIYYVENFLSENEFNTIKTICSNINHNECKDEGYRKIYPLVDNRVNNIFYNDSCKNKVKNIVGNNNIFMSEYPIEYRIYPKNSQGMKCHKDTLLYDKPQYEAVYTIENTSDSYTKWYDYFGQEHRIYTKPNSMLIVKANGNVHCVSGITIGNRSILKLIYTQSNNYNINYKNELNRLNF